MEKVVVVADATNKSDKQAVVVEKQQEPEPILPALPASSTRPDEADNDEKLSNEGKKVTIDQSAIPKSEFSAARAIAGPKLTEYLFKILVVGDIGCGKSSLIKMFCHGLFDNSHRPTIGVDFHLKVMKNIPEAPNSIVRLQLWDVAGQERFGNMTRCYYKDAVAAIVLYDITRPTTLQGVHKWKEDLDDKLSEIGKPFPIMVACNKIDLVPDNYFRRHQTQILDVVLKEYGYCGYMLTSAKTNENVHRAFEFLVGQILSIKENVMRGETNLGLTGSRVEGNKLIEDDAKTCYC